MTETTPTSDSRKTASAVEMDIEESASSRCGLGSCAPDHLQVFSNLPMFSCSAGLLFLLQQTTTIYLSSQVVSLEKAFGLSSTTSGIILSSNEIGFVVSVIFLTYLGRNIHIPRYMGILGVISGFATVACCIPHIVKQTQMSNDQQIPGANNSTSEAYYCTDADSSLANYTCSAADKPATQSNNLWVVGFLCIIFILQGVVKSPRIPLVTTFIDNNVKQKHNSGILLGSVLTLTFVGPALAYGFGSVFSNIPVDLQATSLSLLDPRWIGAWWLGFVALGALILLAAIPFFCYPSYFLQASATTSDKVHQSKMKSDVKGLPKSCGRLLKKGYLVALVFAQTCLVLSTGGSASFEPKYLQALFKLPLWFANILLAIVSFSSLLIGTFIGGALVTRLKLGAWGNLKMVIATNTVICLVSFGDLFLGCENTAITTDARDMFTTNGSQVCNCTGSDFLPMCGTNQTTYFSPCHAGCQNQSSLMYGACVSEPGSVVIPGVCDDQCPFLYYHLAIIFIVGLGASLGSTPSAFFIVRTSEERDQALALGLSSFVVSLVGIFPAPILFGTVVDSACNMWSMTCGERGACTLYDVIDMRLRMTGLAFGLRLLALVTSIISYVCLKFDKSTSVQ